MIIAVAVAVSGATAFAKGKEQKVPQEQVVTIDVTGAGFVPAPVKVKVKANQPVKLVVTRKTDRTCATEIVIKDYGINKPLPLNQPVEIRFTPTKPGKVRYACAMDMIAGVIIVE
jgi:plastocyanin domain-containing protein